MKLKSKKFENRVQLRARILSKGNRLHSASLFLMFSRMFFSFSFVYFMFVEIQKNEKFVAKYVQKNFGMTEPSRLGTSKILKLIQK